MISVKPQEKFVLENPSSSAQDQERILEQVSQYIRQSAPFIKSIHFFNHTKYCTIDIVINDGKIAVIFKNPADELFDLNENPVTLDSINAPIQITGR